MTCIKSAVPTWLLLSSQASKLLDAAPCLHLANNSLKPEESVQVQHSTSSNKCLTNQRAQDISIMVNPVHYVPGAQLASGNSNKVVLKVSLQLEKLEARLQYESNTAPPLGLLSVEAVAVDVTLRPDTLNAVASLGNLKAQDGALPEVGIDD